MKKFLSILLLTLFFGTMLSADAELEKLKELHKNHEVKKYQTWQGWQQQPLINRIASAPQNIIEYIGMDNKIYGYEGVPKTAPLDIDFNNDFLLALQELPPQVKEQLEKYLIGIFFVTDLGSSGFSEHLYKDGEYYGGWILFDQGLLSEIKANEWATWRVNTAFQKAEGYDLNLKIATAENNSRKEAIQFILLHEIGHIIGSSTKAHPKPDEWEDDPKKFPYSSKSWISFKESIYEDVMPKRKDFALYRFDKATLSLKDSEELIADLKKTDFCSLYASNTFFEDFAEAYTIYVHTVLMRKPYKLTLKHNDQEVESFKNPFDTEKMQEKRRYFDRLFGI